MAVRAAAWVAPIILWIISRIATEPALNQRAAPLSLLARAGVATITCCPGFAVLTCVATRCVVSIPVTDATGVPIPVAIAIAIAIGRIPVAIAIGRIPVAIPVAIAVR
jgi:hypothetical protein